MIGLNWQRQALCRDADPELFTGGEEIRSGPLPTRIERAAIAWCERCPVQQECLDYAMAHESRDMRHGVWGGTTPLQRQRIGKRGKGAA